MNQVVLFLKDPKAAENYTGKFSVTTLPEAKEPVTVIVDGPLTELAALLQTKYTYRNIIKEILFVGGSATCGDVTPCAEKNVYDDAYAAKYVFNSEIPMTVFPLDVTRDIQNRTVLPFEYLTNPEKFETEECGMYVETRSELCFGKTVCDILSDAQFPKHNCKMVKKIR